MTKAFLDSKPHLTAQWCVQNPLGRLGMPHELRGVALWLAGDGSTFCTGSEWVVFYAIAKTYSHSNSTVSSLTEDTVPGEYVIDVSCICILYNNSARLIQRAWDRNSIYYKTSTHQRQAMDTITEQKNVINDITNQYRLGTVAGLGTIDASAINLVSALTLWCMLIQ